MDWLDEICRRQMYNNIVFYTLFLTLSPHYSILFSLFLAYDDYMSSNANRVLTYVQLLNVAQRCFLER